jgi:hypothetical protein
MMLGNVGVGSPLSTTCSCSVPTSVKLPERASDVAYSGAKKVP